MKQKLETIINSENILPVTLLTANIILSIFIILINLPK